MATDFFDRQDRARRQTTQLLVLFALAVASIIVAIYLLLIAASSIESTNFAFLHDALERFSPAAGSAVWRPTLLLWVAVGTIVVVGLGSLQKISELSAGGESVALMLGGRAVDTQTSDLAERRLLNVVEEMALASGVPVPPVYVLDNEPAINAFAAGHQPGDAVVAVSGGCLKNLTREELQGVVGHEFSHVLNGDMRMNLRLIGVVHGILVLAILGYYLLRGGAFSSRGSKKGGGAAAVVLLGVALVVLGYVGVFFGKLIRSAINRQREFLADASAVQFTRNPGGIAGALKKIGGLTEGSRIRDGHAGEISHMFFGDAFAGAFFNLFATHPPLAERIRALEPGFDGSFPEIKKIKPAAAAGGRAAKSISGLAEATMALDAGNVVRRIGSPGAENLQWADQTIGKIPQPLLSAAREPFAAQAVVFSLLLSRDDEATRNGQLQLLIDADAANDLTADSQAVRTIIGNVGHNKERIEQPLYRQTQQLSAAVRALPAAARLPLADLTMPAIKRSSPQQYVRFRQIIDALVEADGKIELFEYCLRTVLFSYLDVHFGLKKSPAVRYRKIEAVAQPLDVVLSTLGMHGPQRADFKNFDAALAKLSQASPKVKREVISAVTGRIAADGRVTLEENELFRTIAAVLSCPVPPV